MLAARFSRPPIARIGELITGNSKADAIHFRHFIDGYGDSRGDNVLETSKMNFFRPFGPLLKGWLVSFLGWGMVGFVLGANFVSAAGVPWTRALTASLRDQ